jgi:hypothetical protein
MNGIKIYIYTVKGVEAARRHDYKPKRQDYKPKR